jgi:alkylated DNA repair dioxygenase AlkB
VELFDDLRDSSINLLPHDGEVYYYGKIIAHNENKHFYERLLNEISWANDVAVIFGKRIETKRKVAWYGDKPFEYTYSNNTKTALPWTPELIKLKAITELKTGESFNSCLLNLYHNGSEGMAWHSDGEKDLKENGAIASLSFGAERKFAFKHKQTKEVISLVLESGSLLIMKGATQKNWLHRLPPTKKKFGPRVNLTFRTIVE